MGVIMKLTGWRGNKTIFLWNRGIRWSMVFVCLLWIWGWVPAPCEAQPAPNKIIIDNQSGQNAVVKLVGPTKLVVKVPKQHKKSVRAAQGEYFILVRYGDSDKEFTYTKSDSFAVTQPEDRYSIITFTLYRTKGGDFNVTPASEEEFENAGFSATEPNASP